MGKFFSQVGQISANMQPCRKQDLRSHPHLQRDNNYLILLHASVPLPTPTKIDGIMLITSIYFVELKDNFSFILLTRLDILKDQFKT